MTFGAAESAIVRVLDENLVRAHWLLCTGGVDRIVEAHLDRLFDDYFFLSRHKPLPGNICCLAKYLFSTNRQKRLNCLSADKCELFSTS